METYVVVTSGRETVEVQADEAVCNPDGTRVQFKVGDQVVAAFTGFSQFYRKVA